jgi:hypothetical protein
LTNDQSNGALWPTNTGLVFGSVRSRTNAVSDASASSSGVPSRFSFS